MAAAFTQEKLMSHPRKITRRDLLSTSALVTAGLALLPRPVFAADTKPNIIFILADDMGFADVGCYGRPDVKTPNIDRLAAEGTRFLQAYANSAVCSASRTALITGRYQYRLRVGLEEPINTASTFRVGLPPGHPSLPSLLKKAGYNTALVGKWHLGFLPDFGPLKSGYDHFYGYRSGGVDYFSHKASNHKLDLWDDDVTVDQHGYLTDLLGAKSVDLIDGFVKQGNPFLLSLHFSAPHWPWEAPGDEAESQRLESRTLTSSDSGTQKTYVRMIEAMDAQIGKVLNAVQANHIARNTIVIFTSDNGGERFADTWPFTGRKTELLEGGLRIPAIIRWPGHVPAGATTDQVAIHMDWLPTLLAAAGTAPDPAYPSDGIDLSPMLLHGAPPQPRKLFWRFKANAQRAARDGDYKILKINENSFLFDVVADPMERANLKDRHKDVYDRMVAEWNAWNADMLAEIRESATGGFEAATLADHIGARKASGEIDPADGWPAAPVP
jgi:arylsulfatase A-like enzyme